MAEELGKIEKPEAKKFAKGRRLFFVPLIFAPGEVEGDLAQKVQKYWDEANAQISNLESRLGEVRKVFHEWVPLGGDEGSKIIQQVNQSGYELVRSRTEKGAEVEALEDAELLTEVMDWNRCLSIGMQNQKVFRIVYESFTAASSKRNEVLGKRIDENLGDEEIAILVMREGHQIQFPSDIEVFYVAPPSLDEIKRWVRDREREYAEKEVEKEVEREGEEAAGAEHGKKDQ